MIKAIFFDIDNTLLSHSQGKIPNSAVEAIKIVRSKGIKTFIATGRSYMELNRLPVDKTIFDGFIISNGQICFDNKGEVIRDNPISKEDIARMIPVFENRTVPLVFVQRDRMYMNFSNSHVRKIQKEISSPVPPVGSYSGDKVYQMTAYTDKAPEEIISHLKDVRCSRWHVGAFDLIPKEGGKDYGIRAVMEKYGIDQSETMAFGDSENDISMMNFVKVAVAMGNSMEKTKEAADYITDHIDEDGIYNALKHFKLLD